MLIRYHIDAERGVVVKTSKEQRLQENFDGAASSLSPLYVCVRTDSRSVGLPADPLRAGPARQAAHRTALHRKLRVRH